MYRKAETVYNNNATPKRKRLGVARILRPSQVNRKENEAILRLKSPKIKATPETSESPLPCNQIEYLHNSGNGSTPGSPDVLDSDEDFENWESLVVSRDTLSNIDKATERAKKVVQLSGEDIVNDSCDLNVHKDTCKHINEATSVEKLQQCLQENIDKSFDAINQSICEVHNESKKNSNKSIFLKTRDSFLLEIRESGVINEPNSTRENKCIDNFYGLPLKIKDLFKTYRNIENFYEWQEECLNLKAITEKHNLIYALPTSGGKTLVAEVLMLREVLNRNKNALFILPFVAIVQEKIWSLSPFAVQLDFLVEEYAAGKGHIPPKKRRKKNSIYIATIEKGLALVRSLIELNRLHEIGLIVVDELHLIGEPGRGGTLETLLSTVLYANQNIQIVGMSATIGNLSEVARFLCADVFHRDFRPIELTEYVKLGNMLYRMAWGPDGMEIVPDRELAFDYSAAGASLDPDRLGGLVSEVVPHEACLVFCPTKRNCENVAALLCKLQRRDMMSHRQGERQALARALVAEGASELSRTVRFGIAYHHAGLASDERVLLEQAFRSGVISVLCCTSTLAAGVNLPARRVIIRAPLVGRALLTLAQYRQMIGRAGRAGHTAAGESIMLCSGNEWLTMQGVLRGGLGPARSALSGAVPALVLSAVALGLAATCADLCRLLSTTLMAIQSDEHGSKININEICEESVKNLVKVGALEDGKSELVVSKLGRAAIKGCMDLNSAKQLLQDIKAASKGLVLMGSLHLLYLVTPHDGAGVRPDLRHYYSLYCNLDEEGIQTAKVLGITEMNAVRMMTGKPITNVSEKVLCRFYLALMLHDLWKQVPFSAVADKYCVPRGTVQCVMASSAAFASCCQKFCEELEPLWPYRALMGELAVRLQHCAAPELHQLMELPAVKKARALQLMRAGYKRIEDLAKASVEDLVSSVAHLSRSAATHLVSAARMMLIEKVENLRAEAEDVMEELNA